MEQNPERNVKNPSSWEWEHTHNEVQQLRRRTKRQWIALVALSLVLMAGVGYAYWTIEQNGISPRTLPGVEASLTTLGERLAALEATAQAWVADRDGFRERLTTIEHRVDSALARARKQAQELTAQLHQRMEAELNQRTQALEARLSRIEAKQESERTHLARLQEEMVALRRHTGQDLSTLHQQVSENEQGVAVLASQHKKERVDFELAKDFTRELAPGITLRLTHTNVSHQRIKGWLWLMPDRRTLWVRDLGIQQPLVFHHRDGTGPHELVITTVTEEGAVGYLLRPASRRTSVAGGAAGDEVAVRHASGTRQAGTP